MSENKDAFNELCETALLVTDSVDAMLAYWDKGCLCRFANRAYQQWFGKKRDEILGTHISQLLGPVLYEKNLKYIDGALKGNLQVFEREIPLPSGEIRASIATYTPHIVDGVVEGFFVHVADSSFLKKIERDLEKERARAMELATHDFLTGLPNRVLLVDRAVTIIANAKRNNEEFTVMCMDLDNFKAVNDTLGHDTGDKLLKKIAERIKGAVRENDTLTRIGGDEFILLSSNIKNESDAVIIAKRILDALRKPFKFLEGSGIKPGISIGIAFYPADGKNLDELIKNSDIAMYKAKNGGKNRFEFM